MRRAFITLLLACSLSAAALADSHVHHAINDRAAIDDLVDDLVGADDDLVDNESLRYPESTDPISTDDEPLYDDVPLDEGDDDASWIKEEIEGHEYIILTAALSILRRWKLPLIKMLRPHVPLIELKHHFENGTDPKPPKRFKKIARMKRR